MRFKCNATGLSASASVLAGLMLAGAAQAAEGNTLAWSTASAAVGVCQVGVTCNQPNGVAFVARRQSTESDVVSNSVAVGPADYLDVTHGGYFGNAWASAEAGDGLLGLPELHAYAESRSVGLGTSANPFIGVDVAFVQAVQAYTNTSGHDLVIPLSAFQGTADFGVTGAPGAVSAGLAILTDAILDPSVAGLWSAQGGLGHFGEFTAGCGTAGALAFGQSGATNFNPVPSTTQYLNVAASSCGAATFTLAADQTFYVWARLGVSHSASGVTDASHTFNVTIAPDYAQEVVQNLAPGLTLTSGANLDIPVEAIPEPSAWALMIVGFGAAGSMIRRRKGRAAAVAA